MVTAGSCGTQETRREEKRVRRGRRGVDYRGGVRKVSLLLVPSFHMHRHTCPRLHASSKRSTHVLTTVQYRLRRSRTILTQWIGLGLDKG